MLRHGVTLSFPNHFATDIRILGWVLVAVWSGALALILYLDYQRGMTATQDIALIQARAHFNKDVAFRLWASEHGRIYVPLSDKTDSDKNLAHVPERDIVTPAGQRLTLINPAAIIRQLNEGFGELYGIAGRITSLRPIRPENAPDAWERAALKVFEHGDTEEVIENSQVNGEPYLRLMRPILTAPGCLICHTGADQKSAMLREVLAFRFLSGGCWPRSEVGLWRIFSQWECSGWLDWCFSDTPSSVSTAIS